MIFFLKKFFYGIVNNLIFQETKISLKKEKAFREPSLE
ncbi:hypothetical protein SORDD17_00715 [Streptococcus oralis]|uniref:Uncharacterized protein n=1 Tax=Streptococcus oralis TaxID=1303 RepID=A0A139RMW2_STROR|nr:hypothetical protein SORDD17_00715 [Streptococcus oralis]